MTESEIQQQRDHDAKMSWLRVEFLIAWRIIRKQLPPATLALEQAAWLGFLSGSERKP